MNTSEVGLAVVAALTFVGALLCWYGRRTSRRKALIPLIARAVGWIWLGWALIRGTVYFALDSRPFRLALPELLVILVGAPFACAVLLVWRGRSP